MQLAAQALEGALHATDLSTSVPRGLLRSLMDVSGRRQLYSQVFQLVSSMAGRSGILIH